MERMTFSEAAHRYENAVSAALSAVEEADELEHAVDVVLTALFCYSDNDYMAHVNAVESAVEKMAYRHMMGAVEAITYHLTGK